MNINIYENYKIKEIHKWNVLSEENETIYDNIFVNNKSERIEIIDGSLLIERITNRLKESYLSEFIIVDNKIIIKYFDYNNGENWSITYEILEKSDGNDR